MSYRLCMLLMAVGCAIGFSVSGNRLIGPDGRPFRILGVDRCSLEWAPYGDHLSYEDYAHMKSWGSNTIRVPLNQCFWLSGHKLYNADYKNTVRQQVNWIKSLGMAVILDLHWSDMGNSQAAKCGQQTMADSNSVDFWQQVASEYKNDPWVLFELYNEPHDVAWNVWRNGGWAGSFNTPGFQNLYNTVRNTGADNVVIVGGLNWAYDLSGVAQYALQGDNIMYNTHPYNYPGKQPSDWWNSFGYLTPKYPVIATEFGDGDCTAWYYQQFVDFTQKNGIHWTAWAWYPGGCAFPALIDGWNYTASVSGQVVQQALKNAANSMSINVSPIFIQ